MTASAPHPLSLPPHHKVTLHSHHPVNSDSTIYVKYTSLGLFVKRLCVYFVYVDFQVSCKVENDVGVATFTWKSYESDFEIQEKSSGTETDFKKVCK